MKSILLSALIILLPICVVAQNNADSIKFEMIKETINFYFTDDSPALNISKNKIGFKVDCESEDYECLNTVSKDIKGASDKIKVWRNENIESEDDLKKLKEVILNDVTNIKQGKSYRKKLPGYNAYEEKLEEWVILYNHQDNKQNAIVNPTSQNLVKDLGTQQSQREPMENSLPLIALIASCIAVILSALSLYKKTRNKRSSSSSRSYELDSIKKNIEELHSKSSKFLNKKSLEPLEHAIERLNNRILELEKEDSNTVEWNLNKNTGNIQNENSQFLASDILPISNKSFAKYPNLENGFSSSILKSTQNGEQTYEIEITGDEASYSVSNDAKAQKYALFNYEYLTNACELKNQPEANSKIYTLEKGTLKNSSGNWIIQNKAVIQFR